MTAKLADACRKWVRANGVDNSGVIRGEGKLLESDQVIRWGYIYNGGRVAASASSLWTQLEPVLRAAKTFAGSQAPLLQASLVLYPANCDSGLDVHYDGPDVNLSVTVKISADAEDEPAPLVINGKPFPLQRGQMVVFGKLPHFVPKARRAHERLTLNLFYPGET